MMKILATLLLATTLTGCGLTEAIAITGAIGTIVCNGTTEESRADMREKQRLQTDICGDLSGD